jgi:cyclin-dependent kinase 12/13
MFGIGSLAAYQPITQIGEGAYGCVYRAFDKRSGDIVALKRLIFHKPAAGFPLCAVREIKLLKSLAHRNIVKLKDIITSKGCEHMDVQINVRKDSNPAAAVLTASKDNNNTSASTTNSNRDRDRDKDKDSGKDSNELAEREVDIVSQNCGNLYLVFEYVEHDLGGLIEAKHKFGQRAIKCIMKQLYEVLDYLYSIKIVHRDIKSSNILISNNHHVKLADFGLARSFESADGTEERVVLTNNVVTIWYKSPELLLGAVRYTNAVDIWSAGCVHGELEMGRPLFPGKTDPEQLDLISRALGTPSEDIWPSIVELPHHEAMIVNNPVKYPPNFRGAYEGKLSDGLIGLLERVFVLDPTRRTSARILLSNPYFLTAPLPPQDPVELGPLAGDDAASMHEYETKQKRKRKFEEDKAAAAAKATPPVPLSAVTNALETNPISAAPTLGASLQG